MGKHPTPHDLSVLLKQAGFERSTEVAFQPTEGFRVQWYEVRAAAVTVQHLPGHATGVTAQVREAKQLAAYSEVLRAAGFRVLQDQYGRGLILLVTAEEA